MEKASQNLLVLAREKFKSGEMNKFQFAENLNEYHAGLFDYPGFLAGTDVAEIRITAKGVSVSSAAHNISMLIDAVDLHATPYTLLDFGSYESDETLFLKSVFGNDDVFLDIGANLGWYSLVLGRNCPAGDIYSFEPIPSTVETLERNVRLNCLENIEIVPKGMYNREEALDFLFASDVSGATSLKMVGQGRGRSSIQSVACETTTLDAFCASRHIVPTLLKIDVEGAELMVVQGGSNTLTHTPIILIELLRKWSHSFGYHPNEVFDYLGQYGYQAWAFAEDNSGKLKPCSSITEATTQTNFIFMNPLKHAEVIGQWQA